MLTWCMNGPFNSARKSIRDVTEIATIDAMLWFMSFSVFKSILNMCDSKCKIGQLGFIADVKL